MTFSIRTFLIVIAILACWLGALVSKSPMLVELVSTATALLILLTLAFAIWDTRPEQRAFWTGFFILSFGNLMLAQYFAGYQQTGHEFALRLLGQPAVRYIPSYSPAPSYSPPSASSWSPPAPSLLEPPAIEERFYQPANVYPSTSFPPNPINPSNYYQQQAAIRTAVPNLLSLLVGVIGGWLTQWVMRQKERAGNPVIASP